MPATSSETGLCDDDLLFFTVLAGLHASVGGEEVAHEGVAGCWTGTYRLVW